MQPRPFCLLVGVMLPMVVGAPGGGGSIPSTTQYGQTQLFVTASAADRRQARIVVICLQMSSAGHRPTSLPPLQEMLPGITASPSPPPPPAGQVDHAWAPQAACTQPGTGSPSLWPHVGFTARKSCLGGEEQEAVTLRQVTLSIPESSPLLSASLRAGGGLPGNVCWGAHGSRVGKA